ncbi:TPA: reverse transcriptase [Pseudomonas aeruginosa]|uniref:reverse transcriptase domain-containing protein n=1 Tax=Pseudomonas aeruginosa TaxID=287 RepID=UPI001A1D69F6|nr:reverse transcriptase [Pseudomonas aeruginosa]MCO2125445.1 reverse transcriptase [Pseudomonas aeruginosa]HBO4423377.1 reverse transcriptase [Pseudomonas aeruginosa]HBO4892083.1 reverse transcriptase [Pseudomonas aeruginosa]HEQ1288583.1 reverse transcriptase [Pseudomonas aeruginosa]
MSAARSFKKHFARKSLLRVYTDKIKSSGAIGLDRTRPAKLDAKLNDELELIIQKVLQGAYRFTAYKEKLILKGATSNPRQISIPTARDRIVLRALCECLAEVYPTAKLSLPQGVIEDLRAALASGIYTEYAKIDLKHFYPSIPHSLVDAAIRKKIRKPELRQLIASAITTPTVPESQGRKDTPNPSIGVPQGLAVSNLLAEISLQDIDLAFKSRPNIWYKRYVDDILILTPKEQSEAVANELITELKSMRLQPHEFGPESKSKFAPLTEPFSFLGYQIEGGQIIIRRESILRFESSIAKIFTAYRHKVATARSPKDMERARAYCEWKVNLRITGCFFGGKRRGWASYFSQITSTKQLRSVNHTIRNLTTRFSLDGKIKTKSLIKTFYELRRGRAGNHNYIPNLDDHSLDEKRALLALWIGDDAYQLSAEKVERLFEIKVTKAVRELEEDIAQTS